MRPSAAPGWPRWRLAGRAPLAWFTLAVAAFGVSTLFALALVLSRTPPFVTGDAGLLLFRRALVLHVDLALLVWFLSSAALFWTARGRARSEPGGAFWSCVIGTALMVLSPLSPRGTPYLSDYIPLLLNAPFVVGLALFVAGIGVTLAPGWRRWPGLVRRGLQAHPVSFGIDCVALALVAALATLLLAALATPPPATTRIDTVTWAVGHVLQFGYALLLAVAWSWLATEAGLLGRGSRRRLNGLLLVGLLPALAGPLLFFAPLDPVATHEAFRWLMVVGGWVPAVPLGLLLLARIARRPAAAGGWAAVPLLLSLLLCLVGIGFGFLIRDNSAMVPAHYHGTVGALTLSLMAVGWRLLADCGEAFAERLVRLQQLLYGGGMLTLIAGLAWSGWLGAPRKVAGAAGLGPGGEAFASMLLMGFGGVAAIAGALLFAVPIGRRLARRLAGAGRRAAVGHLPAVAEPVKGARRG